MKTIWKNNSRRQLKVGMKVRVNQTVRKVVALYADVPGGVILDKAVLGFKSWNTDELFPL